MEIPVSTLKDWSGSDCVQEESLEALFRNHRPPKTENELHGPPGLWERCHTSTIAAEVSVQCHDAFLPGAPEGGKPAGTSGMCIRGNNWTIEKGGFLK